MWDIISVKLERFSVVLIDIVVYFELVYSFINTDGGHLVRTCYSETGHDYLIIKLAIVFR